MIYKNTNSKTFSISKKDLKIYQIIKIFYFLFNTIKLILIYCNIKKKFILLAMLLSIKFLK